MYFTLTANLGKQQVTKTHFLAIQELISETSEGGQLNATQLSQAVAVLNSRLRSPGVSEYEIYTHETRQQVTSYLSTTYS